MYRISRKRVLNAQVTLYEIDAPRVAKKALPGQFIVLRIDDRGERVPFTIAACDAARGTVTIIVQEVGLSTGRLAGLSEGDYVMNFAGPLGLPTHFDAKTKRAVVIGGGLGSAIAYPQAKNLYAAGTHVDTIVGFRTKELVILEDEMKSVSSRLIITTDDGSYGEKGFVTEVLKKLIGESDGDPIDVVVAIGPPIMMKAVCALTLQQNIKTIVSLNPIMVDGTGMCGCCRVTVGGNTRFACVDGPDFDGHEVDFDELILRNSMYREQEKLSFERHTRHICNLDKALDL